MSKPPTQRDVALRAGVSSATVSHVVSGRPDRALAATPEVVERVQKAIAELGYRPHRAGRVLRSQRTGLIAVAARVLHPWALTAITQIEEVANQHGLGVITVRYGGPEERSTWWAEHLLSDGIADAAVIFYGSDFGADRIRRIADRGMPLLAFGLARPQRGVDVLVQHEEAAVASAARHLLDSGARRIVYFSSGTEDGWPDRRADAFATTIAAAARPCVQLERIPAPAPALSPDVWMFPRALEIFQRPARTRPDAVMSGSDRGAIIIMWAAIQQGLRIPDDLRVIGAGNIIEGNQVSPQLTTVGTVDVDYRPAVEHLIRRIGQPVRRSRTFSVPWSLIRRGTA